MRRYALVAVAAAVVLAAGSFAAHSALAGSAATTAATPRSAATTVAPVGARSAIHHSSQAVLRAEGQAVAAVRSYLASAWCGPLDSSSGHSLRHLWQSVAADTATYSSTAVPAQTTGQIPASFGRAPTHVNLASADAIISNTAAPSERLTTYFCYALPHWAPVRSTGGTHINHLGPMPKRLDKGFGEVYGSRLPYSTGTPTWATDEYQVEAGYAITLAGKTTYHHIWFSGVAHLVERHGAMTLARWDFTPAGRNTPEVALWASETPAKRPVFLVPEPNGAWSVHLPPPAPGGA